MQITEIKVDGEEKVVRCQDVKSGLYALLAIHDTTLGPALGGIRMWPYASDDEALFDILQHSRAMTLKTALAEAGFGGGKSVILASPERDKNEALLEAMGEFIESQGGRYISAEDINISRGDLAVVRRKTRWVTGIPESGRGPNHAARYTAEGCVVGLRAVAEEIDGEMSLNGRRIVLQGVGAVGGQLAVLLQQEGAEVTVCDVDAARQRELQEQYGLAVIEDARHLDVECDIYMPCARGACLNDDTIPKLKCKAVAGCANRQLLEPRHGQLLRDRGIHYAPDYVMNAGSVINAGAELSGETSELDIRACLVRIYNNIKKVFEMSRQQDIPTNEAAERLALERIAAGPGHPEPTSGGEPESACHL